MHQTAAVSDQPAPVAANRAKETTKTSLLARKPRSSVRCLCWTTGSTHPRRRQRRHPDSDGMTRRLSSTLTRNITDAIITPTPSPLTPVTDGIDTPTPSPLTPSPLTPESPATPVSDPSDLSDVSTVSNNDGGNADGVATHQLARTANSSARTKRRRCSTLGRPPLLEAVDFPADPALPQLERLFDPEWVWDASVCRFPEATDDPCRLRIRQFSHLPGRFATVNYEAQWPEEAFLAPEFFTVTLRRDNTAAVSRFPHDDALPGLAPAVDPDSALRLVDQHVFAVPRRLMAVETVRYRPARRGPCWPPDRQGSASFAPSCAPLRCRPAPQRAAELIDASPRCVAHPVGGLPGAEWSGGVGSQVPGVNCVTGLASGHAPDPALLLDGLHSLGGAAPLTEPLRQRSSSPGANCRVRAHLRSRPERRTPTDACCARSPDPRRVRGMTGSRRRRFITTSTTTD